MNTTKREEIVGKTVVIGTKEYMIEKINKYLIRLFNGLKVSKGKLDKHNVFFTDYRVRQGRRIGASRKQLLRNRMLSLKID